MTPLAGPGGVWTEEELTHHAGLLAMSFVSQNSCNCLAPKLVVVDKDWPQRQAFITAVHDILRRFPALPPHYPGTTERYNGFRAAYSTRQEIASGRVPTPSETTLPPALPWMFVHLDETSDKYALKNEAFAPVLAFYSLPGNREVSGFLKRALSFVNDEVWLSRGCYISCGCYIGHIGYIPRHIGSIGSHLLHLSRCGAPSCAVHPVAHPLHTRCTPPSRPVTSRPRRCGAPSRAPSSFATRSPKRTAPRSTVSSTARATAPSRSTRGPPLPTRSRLARGAPTPGSPSMM